MPKVTQSTAKVYRIVSDDRWDWAHFYVEEWEHQRTDGSQTWGAYLTIQSSYGLFGYCFSHMGQPLHEFLNTRERDYFMNKMHPEYRVFDWEEALKRLRTDILQYRRRDDLTKDEAREFYDAVVDVADGEEGGAEHLCARLSEECGGWWDRWELWEYSSKAKVNPQCEGLWAEFWPTFIQTLKKEAADAKELQAG